MRLLRLIWRVYSLSTWLYPADLRKMHEDEMRDVFRCQTLDAYEKGSFELLRVLGCAMAELFTCALPLRAQSPAAIAGAASLLVTSAAFLFLLWALQNPIAVQRLGKDVNRAILQAMR
jgi:hypothetical protein